MEPPGSTTALPENAVRKGYDYFGTQLMAAYFPQTVRMLEIVRSRSPETATVAAGREQPVQVMLFGHRNAPLWQIDFRGRRPQRHEIVALAETFFGGGTDLERPISAAIDLISNRGEGAGQIVLISDGLCEVAEEWLSRVWALKARRHIEILTTLVDLEASSDRSPVSLLRSNPPLVRSHEPRNHLNTQP